MVIRHTIYSTFILICIIICKSAEDDEEEIIFQWLPQCTEGYVLNAYIYRIVPNTKVPIVIEEVVVLQTDLLFHYYHATTSSMNNISNLFLLLFLNYY